MSALIRYFNTIRPLTQEEKSHIAGLIKTVELLPGQRWAEYGTSTGIGYVERGLLKKITQRNKILGFLREGNGLVLAPRNLKLIYEAIESTILHYIGGTDMELIQQYHPLGKLAISFMAKDMRTTRILLDIFHEPDYKARYRMVAERRRWFLNRVPKKELADYSNTKTVQYEHEVLVLHFNCSTNKYISAINKATID